MSLAIQPGAPLVFGFDYPALLPGAGEGVEALPLADSVEELDGMASDLIAKMAQSAQEMRIAVAEIIDDDE